MRNVGVMGDGSTYSHAVALRAVTSTDVMISDWSRHMKYKNKKINRIVNEVDNVHQIVLDVTSKPRATIEWNRKMLKF